MDTILNLAQNLWNTVIPFIVLLGVLIFVHELGHFLVARLCGVRVEVFSLGFGKKLLQYRRGDTNYCLSLIPLGGYVKMFGEQPGSEIAPELRKVSFTHKHVLKRIAIVLAGPLMNFVFAVFIFALVAGMGEEKKPAVVGDLTVESEAFQAGFRPGDKILSAGGKSLVTWEDLQGVLNENIGREIAFEVQGSNSQESKSILADVTASENPNPLAPSRIVGAIAGLQAVSRGTHVAILNNSVLASLNIKTGDQIKAINDKPVKFWREVETALRQTQPGQEMSFTFARTAEKSQGGEEFTVNLKSPQANEGLHSVGIEPTDLYLAEVIKNSPAQNAGLQKGDRLVQIGSTKLENWEDVINTIKAYDETSGPMEVVVFRNGQVLNYKIHPQMTSHMDHLGKEVKRFTIGIAPLISLATEDSLTVKAAGPVAAIARGYEKSYDFTVMTLLSFVRLIQGEISPKNVGGVISIGAAASESFKAGLNYFLQMMGIISISLFVLNLLPIPVLDGGHLVFYTVELVKGSPVSLKKMEMAQQVGIVLLMSLMLFALYNDFTRLLGLY